MRSRIERGKGGGENSSRKRSNEKNGRDRNETDVEGQRRKTREN